MCVSNYVPAVKCPLARDIAKAFRAEATELLGQTGAGIEAAAAARALILAAKVIDEKNRASKEDGR